MTCYFE